MDGLCSPLSNGWAHRWPKTSLRSEEVPGQGPEDAVALPTCKGPVTLGPPPRVLPCEIPTPRCEGNKTKKRPGYPLVPVGPLLPQQVLERPGQGLEPNPGPTPGPAQCSQLGHQGRAGTSPCSFPTRARENIPIRAGRQLCRGVLADQAEEGWRETGRGTADLTPRTCEAGTGGRRETGARA